MSSSTAFLKACRRRGLAVVLAIGGPLLPQAALADCATAPQAVQSMLCADDSLSQAWGTLETRLADLTKAHPDLAEPLAEDQALFLSLMEKTHEAVQAEHPADEVPGIMLIGLEERLAFLEALDLSPKAGLTGQWENASGMLLILPEGAKQAKVQLSVMEPVMGLNTCMLEGSGMVNDGVLTIELPSQATEELSLTLAGEAPLLGVDLTRGGRAAQTVLNCMDSPAVTGWYFPVKHGG